MSSKQELQFLIKKYHCQPRKEQGQHFLLDEDVVQKMADAAALTQRDTVLEIGPGFGILTQQLLSRAGNVIAVEQDRDLFPVLPRLAATVANLTPVCADIRRANIAELGFQDLGYHLLANLPYSISSWVLRQFSEVAPRPRQMVVMLQKEVAQRVTAKPGMMSVLSVALQMLTDVRFLFPVPRTSFYPMPKVESAVVQIFVRQKPHSADPKGFLRLVKIGFASRRKQLQNNLRAGLRCSREEIEDACRRASINPTTRAEELSVADWERLRRAFVFDSASNI